MAGKTAAALNEYRTSGQEVYDDLAAYGRRYARGIPFSWEEVTFVNIVLSFYPCADCGNRAKFLFRHHNYHQDKAAHKAACGVHARKHREGRDCVNSLTESAGVCSEIAFA